MNLDDPSPEPPTKHRKTDAEPLKYAQAYEKPGSHLRSPSLLLYQGHNDNGTLSSTTSSISRIPVNKKTPRSSADSELPRSLSRDITPPPSKRPKVQAKKFSNDSETESDSDTVQVKKFSNDSKTESDPGPIEETKDSRKRHNEVAAAVRREDQIAGIQLDSSDDSHLKLFNSPFQLTRIRDLSEEDNVDTITLHDILRDPMIKECWQFNFLFDIHFIMAALDPDVAATVRVKIVHGFWKAEDETRLHLYEQAQAYPNVQLIAAHMPEPFGTHHSKMMIMIRHDDTAQVVIHTANMIARDWANLTQGVWRSPLLPLLSATVDDGQSSTSPIGSGVRFKADLNHYLKAYQNRTRSLVEELEKYDFSAISAAFISSAPGRFPDNSSEEGYTQFGWLGLRQVLSSILCPRTSSAPGSIVVEISSIATLSEKWLDNFLFVLRSAKEVKGSNSGWTIGKKPRVRFIFPSDEEVRSSLDGYASGASIHMKIQSAAQAKQLKMLRPMLCHWAATNATNSEAVDGKGAHRGRAAPHIKTYIRFKDEKMEEIQWAMLTSANLSQQAWGAIPSGGHVRISSYEVGVVIWPQLFLDPGEWKNYDVRMVPMFGKDTPTEGEAETFLECNDHSPASKETSGTKAKKKQVVVGVRMPYDLPLTPYGAETMPWCASATYHEPDWKGVVWGDVDTSTLAKLRGAQVMHDVGDG